MSSPEGEGSVSFTVRAFDNLATGTTVANGAEIVFDINEPIVTPTWSNVVDLTAPTSSVQPLTASGTNPIEITVAGSDAGSGIQLFGLFASKDDGPFTLVQTSLEPTFSFEGEEGSSYGFYSVASDFVQNTEPLKSAAEAVTVVTVGTEDSASDLPLVLTLDAPFPNPAGDEANLRFGLPRPGKVRVRVYDMIGREVMRLDEERLAGWHPLVVDVGLLAAGVYTVVMDADRSIVTKQITVVR
jgi:hypothetical protein